MSAKKIAIGAVNKAFELKSVLQDHLTDQSHDVLDLGCFKADEFVEYLSVGEAVAHAVYSGDADFGIVCCKFGCSACTGVAKFQGVIAFPCESLCTAAMCRKVNGANVLCMGQSVVSPELACQMADTFVGTEFLDLNGVPEKVREFRRQARDQVIRHGEIPKSRQLQVWSS